MIILLGVTVNFVANGGLLDRAKQASTQYQIEADREMLLADVVASLDLDGKVELQLLKTFATADGFNISGEEFPVTATSKSGNEFSISENGEITYTGEGEYVKPTPTPGSGSGSYSDSGSDSSSDSYSSDSSESNQNWASFTLNEINASAKNYVSEEYETKKANGDIDSGMTLDEYYKQNFLNSSRRKFMREGNARNKHERYEYEYFPP